MNTAQPKKPGEPSPFPKYIQQLSLFHMCSDELLEQLLRYPAVALRLFLSSCEAYLKFYLCHRFVPDSDIKQEWIEHTRKVIARLRAELQSK
jgi:hypothetical protein